MSDKKPYQKTIAVDFDGVIHAFTSPWTTSTEIPDGPVPGAIDWLRALLNDGWRVWLHTCRLTNGDPNPAVEDVSLNDRIEAVCDWFLKYGPDVYSHYNLALWTHGGKPMADVYLDDKALRFTGTFPSADDLRWASVSWAKGTTSGRDLHLRTMEAGSVPSLLDRVAALEVQVADLARAASNIQRLPGGMFVAHPEPFNDATASKQRDLLRDGLAAPHVEVVTHPEPSEGGGYAIQVNLGRLVLWYARAGFVERAADAYNMTKDHAFDKAAELVRRMMATTP